MRIRSFRALVSLTLLLTLLTGHRSFATAGAGPECEVLLEMGTPHSLSDYLAEIEHLKQHPRYSWWNNSEELFQRQDTYAEVHLAEVALRDLQRAKTAQDVLALIDNLLTISHSRAVATAIGKFSDEVSFDPVFNSLKLNEAETAELTKGITWRSSKLIDYQRRIFYPLFERFTDAANTSSRARRIAAFVKSASRQTNFYTSGFLHWMAWDALENLERRQQPVGWISINVTRVPEIEVDVRTVRGLPLENDMAELLLNPADHSVRWPQHPRNTSDTVPFRESSNYPVVGTLEIHYTASRSMIVKGTTQTIKLPTDNPTPNENNATKADLRKGVRISLKRGDLIKRIDREMGVHPKLSVLYDVAAFVDKESLNGFTTRDIAIFNNGNYWLPSHSINTMATQISGAKTLYESRDFWIANYVRPMARAKALLLLRYGIQMKFPHLQQSVTEYLPGMKPTGRIAIRDVSDTFFVRPIAEVVAPAELREEIEAGYNPPIETWTPVLGSNSKSNGFRQTSIGALDHRIIMPELSDDEDDARRTYERDLNALEDVEEQFIVDSVREELRLSERFASMADLQRWLFSSPGLDRVRWYHGRGR